jgi:16S rRNA processing protein RimM
MPENWDEMAVVGTIARAHGRRGEVIVNLETDFPETRFRPGAEVFVATGGSAVPLRLTTVRFQHGRPVIGIAGVETMDDADALAGQELRVPRGRLAPLPKDTFYRHDLVGCQVETLQGEAVGVVEGVEGTFEGSRLVVSTSAGEALIPLVLGICTTIDTVRRRIVIDPPEGLLALNQKS